LASDRLQRRIERLLDEAEEAVSRLDWQVVHDRGQAVLVFDPENAEGGAFLAAAERALGGPRPPLGIESTDTTPANIHNGTPLHPTSFASGRYQAERFLGEGEKKKGYLAHDTTLDREVAFALIKLVLSLAEGTDGLD
jgi:hypothetical protein